MRRVESTFRNPLWLVAGLTILGLELTACGHERRTHETEHPADVVKIEGSDLNRLTLTERAARRIDLKTEPVREQWVLRAVSARKVVPYSSLIYDLNGQTWVYTSPEPRTFVREKVDVDFIEGDTAVLRQGPPTGTLVASVGVAELYGTEFKVGH